MKKFFFGFVALSALLFTGCTDEPKQGNEGAKSSTNYVQCNANMKVVNVAGGFEGFFQLPINGGDWRDVSEPRTDLVKH